MKHIKDAKQLFEEGDAQGALEILNHLLGLSPKNPQALLMKASIYDNWGRFDEALEILHQISKISSDEDILNELDHRMAEERKSLVYSKLTHNGRWYFPFSPWQVFVSLFGLMGCILFLISSPSYYHEPHGGWWVALSFLVLVLLPWLIVVVFNLSGLKKILVGMQGIHIFRGLKKIHYSWNEISCAVIEYDWNLKSNYLQLILYSRTTREPMIQFDISKKTGVVRARRHFVRLILSYVDVVSYVSRGKATEQDRAYSSHQNAA